MSAKICVISTAEEQRIAPNLRSALLKRDPQIFRLDSEVAYELEAFKKVAEYLLTLDGEQIKTLLAAGALTEVTP